ncbi:hypothetical protein LCGC14_1320900 [marine sediment metagenome]|uniref:site-specific DNA-methyltransferase (cytosine-N(4)-specific) n=1 Tax=marine sediment metagenome TaxID=412755 RepID=A0A0F9N0D5_9ZZZZ
MTMTFDNGVVQLHHGSALDMAMLPDGTVDTVVTSPPYWGLRDYGLPATIWDDHGHGCTHQWEEHIQPAAEGTRTLEGNSALKAGHQGSVSATMKPKVSAFCTLCGAWRGTLGLEPTPQLYVQHLTQIFREVWRVLKPWGTVWLNLGDSYSGSGGAHTTDHGNPGLSKSASRDGYARSASEKHSAGLDLPVGLPNRSPFGLKAKDLVLIPERVALALQDDGWWVRSRIAWCKTAPMPESVDDRPTSAWEHIWLLTKDENYFWDKEAVREDSVGASRHDLSGQGYLAPGQSAQGGNRKSKRPDGWDTGPGGHGTIHRNGREPGGVSEIRTGRNMRNWWVINPEPMGWEMCQGCGMIYDPGQYRRLGRLVASYCDLESGEEKTKTYISCKRCGEWEHWMSHFATFPQAVVEPCILAGTSEKGNCAECGRPWERVTETTGHVNQREPAHQLGNTPTKVDSTGWAPMNQPSTNIKGEQIWQPTCSCDAGTVPAIVLDPFMGSGTVGVVAQKLGRRAVGVDQSAHYLALAQERIAAIPLPMVMT